jgi:hypothetical protein
MRGKGSPAAARNDGPCVQASRAGDLGPQLSISGIVRLDALSTLRSETLAPA